VGCLRFKSCHSDQILWSDADFPQLSATAVISEAPKVHKSVHRRELRMVKLRQDDNGNYFARKRLPDDVSGSLRVTTDPTSTRSASQKPPSQ
jgi:hypothetical protein